MATSFVTTADGHGGTLITEAAQTVNQLVYVEHAAHGMNVNLPSWSVVPMPSAQALAS
jgi:hypothetical protein